MRVLIAGGGVGGVAAALAASRSGAEVILVEGGGVLGLNRAMLPYVLSGECPPEDLRLADASGLLRGSGVEVRLRERVLSVDSQSRTARVGDRRMSFDSVVLATGARCVGDDVRGAAKNGVFHVRSLDDYLALYRSSGALSHVAVMGAAPLSLMVAQALAGRSKVRVFLGAGGLSRFSPRIGRRVVEAAHTKGFELFQTDIDAIVGTGRVEAAISRGKVHPCDAVVVLPRSSPSVPVVDCELGDHGGVLVDRSMRTTSSCIFAAGDCAELRLGSASLSSMFHSSSRVMGEVAGLNAVGARVRSCLTGSMALELFGLEVCASGIEVDEGIRAGLDLAREETEEDVRDAAFGGGRVVTSVVFDRSTRRVHGIQAAGPGALALSGYASLAVASGSSLEDLAYHDFPYLPNFNRDKSPIALTAGKGLASVQDRIVDAQGTRLRRH